MFKREIYNSSARSMQAQLVYTNQHAFGKLGEITQNLLKEWHTAYALCTL